GADIDRAGGVLQVARHAAAGVVRGAAAEGGVEPGVKPRAAIERGGDVAVAHLVDDADRDVGMAGVRLHLVGDVGDPVATPDVARHVRDQAGGLVHRADELAVLDADVDLFADQHAVGPLADLGGDVGHRG